MKRVVVVLAVVVLWALAAPSYDNYLAGGYCPQRGSYNLARDGRPGIP